MRIARWLDWEYLAASGNTDWINHNFIPTDADMLTLLPLFIERGYDVRFEGCADTSTWMFRISRVNLFTEHEDYTGNRVTIADAVLDALMSLITFQEKQ